MSIMPEADRLSPARLPALLPSIDAELAARLAALPSSDTVFARALADRPIVLGVAGVSAALDAAPQGSVRAAPARVVGGDPAPYLRAFEATLRSLDEIDRAAVGHGLLNVELEGRAVRRVPLAARIGDTLVPALAMEMFRVASGAPGFVVTVGPHGITQVAVGALTVPTQVDGSVWLHYARHTSARFVSAADVLAGTADRRLFERKLVLIGVTALGLSDRRPIPGGGTMDGVEIHAELIESLFDNTVLARPRWAVASESAFLFVGGLLLILAVPIKRARAAWLVLLPLLVLALGGSLALYRWRFLLFDAVMPAAGLIVTFIVMLGVTLSEAERQRRLLRRQVELQREAAARFEGELQAAPSHPAGDPAQAGRRCSPASGASTSSIVLEPAREVGGDLYDFFMLDRDRLFFLLGDVAGKGLAGSLFMAVSKSLYKSTALRARRRRGHHDAAKPTRRSRATTPRCSSSPCSRPSST